MKSPTRNRRGCKTNGELKNKARNGDLGQQPERNVIK